MRLAGYLLALAAATVVVVSQEEVQVSQLLGRVDANMDGLLSRSELGKLLRAEHFDRYRRKYEARVEGLEHFYEHDHPVRHVLDKHDDMLHNDHHVAMTDDLDPKMDADGDGRLSVHELMAHMGLPPSVDHMMDDEIDALLREADEDGDGAVSHQEAFRHQRALLQLVSHDEL
eukprot:g2289.t1